MQTMQVVWLVLMVVLLILEASTAAMVSIWFALGALGALITAIFAPTAFWAQAIVFIIVSGVALVALRPFARKWVNPRRVATNADANLGKTAQVVGEIRPGRFGRVRLEGLEWTAKSDEVLQVGAWCTVKAIEGVKLVVVPAEEPGKKPAEKAEEPAAEES